MAVLTTNKKSPLFVLIACAFLAPAHGQEVPGCGSLQNAYGPFDYRDPAARAKNLPIVEQYHFTTDVEMLVRGTSGTVAGDLAYTLRAFPNHPRALQAMSRFALRGGHLAADSPIASPECFFRRALAFAPDDPVPHAIFGSYLLKTGDKVGAEQQYEQALQLAPDSAEINYNAALFYLDQGDVTRAKALAKIAYDKGYPLQGLRKRLEAADAHGGPPAQPTNPAK